MELGLACGGEVEGGRVLGEQLGEEGRWASWGCSGHRWRATDAGAARAWLWCAGSCGCHAHHVATAWGLVACRGGRQAWSLMAPCSCAAAAAALCVLSAPWPAVASCGQLEDPWCCCAPAAHTCTCEHAPAGMRLAMRHVQQRLATTHLAASAHLGWSSPVCCPMVQVAG